MKEQILKYAERIDAMSLRERVMIFLATVVVLVSLVFNSMIEPLLVREKRLAKQIEDQQKQTRVLQDQLQALGKPQGESKEVVTRQKLAQATRQIAELDAQLAEREKHFVRPQRVAAVIEGVLLKNRQLSLVSMRNLPAAPIGSVNEAAKGGASGVFRHGVEVTVRGAYGPLTEYLASLEKMPDQIYWGGAEMNADGFGGTTVKLTFYTISLNKAWLAI